MPLSQHRALSALIGCLLLVGACGRAAPAPPAAGGLAQATALAPATDTPAAAPATATTARAATVAPATPAATAAPAPSPLPNGDFEQGDDQLGWVFDSAAVAITSEPGAGVTARSGAYVARVRQSGESAALRSARFTVPAELPYLSYWVWLESTESRCNDDTASLRVHHTLELSPEERIYAAAEGGGYVELLDHFEVCAGLASPGWVNRTVDLRRFRGASIAVSFAIPLIDPLDGQDSALYLDDLVLQAAPEPAPGPG